jgi:hypothetical protein
MDIMQNQLSDGYISEDVIKLNNIEKSLKIKFILGEELYNDKYSFSESIEYVPINFAGYIGLSIDSVFRQDFPDSLPLYLYDNYKDEQNFKSPFSIIFDKVKDKNSYKGKLILNGYPHEYNNSYNEKQYISTRLQKNSENYLDWCIALDNVYYYDNIIEENNKIIFRPELGIIVINMDLFNYLRDNFFKEYIDKKMCEEKSLGLIGQSYKYYICNKEIDITKFKDVNFELKDININFTINYMDVFYEYNNKFFFLMVSKTYIRQNYIFGSIIMKKYDFVFDKFKSKIGVYNKNINNNEDTENNTSDDNEEKEGMTMHIVLIVSIAILCILIILVIIYIIWSYLNKPRIQRKNELNDNYNYISESEKIN